LPIANAISGSGKTAAFLIPTISKLMGKVKKLAAPRPNTTSGSYEAVRAEPLILIVAPTRELCCQIFDEARRLCYRSMLRPCVAYGGAPSREQRIELGKGCDVLVATPGRLLDFLRDSRVLSLNRVRFTIIDEADEMLHEDWSDELGIIFGGHDVNEDDDHQYLLKNDHVRIRIGRSGAVHNEVAQKVVYVERQLKQKALYDLLIDMPPARTMVFVKSKKTADFLDDFLFNQGMPSTSIHSDSTQREREDSM
jgi:ATP-dependent RNA helicase DDX3X